MGGVEVILRPALDIGPLVVGGVTMTAHAASPVPGVQYQAFKIGSYSALAIKDGALQDCTKSALKARQKAR
jgi:hypothetical protein